VRSFTRSRRTRFLAASAVVVTIGIGGGGLAYAASSGSTPSASRECSGLSLTPVPGVKAPKITKTETPLLIQAKPIVCGSRGTTSAR
jgi:hypothetical protein